MNALYFLRMFYEYIQTGTMPAAPTSLSANKSEHQLWAGIVPSFETTIQNEAVSQDTQSTHIYVRGNDATGDSLALTTIINDTGAVLTPSYVSTGTYRITSDLPIFEADKTIMNIRMENSSPFLVSVIRVSNTVLEIENWESFVARADYAVFYLDVEILP